MLARNTLGALCGAYLIALALLVSGVGCGSVAGKTAQHAKAEDEISTLAAPPIVKLDHTISSDDWRQMTEVGGTACVSASGSVTSPCSDISSEPPEARETTKVYAGLRDPSQARFEAYVVTYYSRHNGACWMLADDLRALSPDCTATEKCDDNCWILDKPDYGPDRRNRLLATIVPAKARSIRLTFTSGRSAAYALTGPLYPGLPDRRVFIVDLGHERLKFTFPGRRVVPAIALTY